MLEASVAGSWSTWSRTKTFQLFPVGEAAEAVVAQLVKRLDLMFLKEVQLS